MTEYAPKAITDCFNRIQAGIPSAIMAGVIGDSAHTYGYHRCRDVVSSSDYSVQLTPDKKGDGQAACGLDISWNKASDQYTVSQRLLNAKNDTRLTKAVREFYGSTDGRNVCGWDYQGGYAVTSDDSHLWHIHLSFLRQYSNDSAALAAVADVITGGSSAPQGDDMPKQIYLYTKSGQVTTLAKAGTWYCVNWNADLANTGGMSLTLPKGTGLFSMTGWLSMEGLPLDGNIYWRVQTLRGSDGTEIAKFPVAEQRGTTGGTALACSQVGSVSTGTQTNLRLLAAATQDNVRITSAWWRCLYW